MPRYAELPGEKQRVFDQAAAWHSRLETDPALEVSSEFLAWYAAPENSAAYDAVETGLKRLDAAGSSAELLEMRRAALARMQRRRSRDWFVRHLGKIAAVLALIVVGALVVGMQQPTTYATEVGERRVVSLADGSRVSLDSDSAMRVKYTEGARLIELRRGRGRFDVAHDPTRPFKVTAGSETVVAVGTSFEVELLHSKVVVTLYQGRVVVSGLSAEHPKPSRLLSLKPGQQLVARRDQAPSVTQTNLQTANAWQAGQLVFRDEPLREAVERVNRYTARPVAVDSSVADLRVSGGFSAGDVGSFVAGVTSYFDVEADTTQDNRILLRRKPALRPSAPHY